MVAQQCQTSKVSTYEATAKRYFEAFNEDDFTAIAALFAFVAALGALHFMMRLLQSVSFTPYVIYRVALGIALLVYAYG